MNRTFLILGIVAILAAASLLVVGSNPPAHIEATKIRVGYLPLIHGLPLYYATEKEYFKDAGLDVELIKFESPNQIIDALLQNNLDLGSTSTPLGITGIADYKNPGKLKIYAASGGDLDNPAEILLVSPDSNISSIGDLKGKKLGILGSSIQWRTIVRYMLDRNDLEMDKDVIIVELAPSLQVQALASKQIDALLALEPIATIAKEKGVGKESIRGPVEKIISNPFYGGAGVITEKFASENPNTTIKIMGIIARSIKEIDKNPEAAKPYLKGYTSLTDDLVNKVPIAIIKMCESLTEDDVNSIQKFYDIFTLYKVVDGKIDFNKISFCRAG